MAKSEGATAEAERANKVTITDAGPCLKKISIEIPADAVTEQLSSSVETAIVDIELPGFRKGRAPRRLVEKKLGSAVRREAKNQLVASAYQQAVEDNKLKVIGEPTSETLADIEVEDGKPLTFEIEIEVLPEFETPKFEGVEIKRPAIEVTDEIVAKELERLRMHEGVLEGQDDPEPGDYLTGRAVMKLSDGAVHLDLPDAVVQVPTADKSGRGMILGIMVEDFAQQMGDPEPEMSFTIKTKGPDLHEDAKLRGEDLTIEFEVKRADRIIPASVADLAAKYGLADEAALRDAIRGRMRQRVGAEQQGAMHQQLARWLIDSTEIELPARVTTAQSARNLQRRRLELMHRGVDATAVEEQAAELRAASQESAKNELKLFFILHKIAEELDVKVTEAEINGRIAQIALSRGERPDRFRQDLIKHNQVGSVFQQVREHKTMNAILEKASIADMPVEEYNKLMAEQSSARSAPAKKAPSEKPDDEGKPEAKKPAAKGKKKAGAE